MFHVKRLLAAASALLLAAAIVACGTVPTATVNDKAAIAMRSVTAARQTSTAFLTAGKITVAQDQATQARLDLVVGAVKAGVAANDAAQIDAAKATADKINANPGATTP